MTADYSTMLTLCCTEKRHGSTVPVTAKRDGLCASEVDKLFVHYTDILPKEVVVMVANLMLKRYHFIRIQITQTTSGPQGSITD